MQRDLPSNPHAASSPKPPLPVARVYFACANRYISVLDARPNGTIARCPQCGRSNRLPPRTDSAPSDRFFEIAC